MRTRSADSNAPKYGVAIIGTGVAARMHALQFQAHNHFVIRNVFGTSVTRARALGADLGTGFTTNLEHILDDNRIDICIIATLPIRHASLINSCVRAGKIVFAEKPVGVSLSDHAILKRLSKRQRERVYVNFNRRFDPSVQQVIERLRDSGNRPEFVQITSRDKGYPAPHYLRSCGGLAVDTMSHDFDLLRFITKRTITAAHFEIDKSTQRFPFGFDQHQISAQLRLQGNVIATIHCARGVGYGYDQRLQVVGRGYCFESAYQPPDRCVIHSECGTVSTNFANNFVDRYNVSFAYSVEQFWRSIERQRPFSPGLDDGLYALQWGLKIQRRCQ